MKSKRDREEPCYICGHYHDEKKQGETIIPTAIMPGFLYLGSYDTASRSEILKTMGITHILNTVPTCEALYKNTFQYHTVSSSPPSFQECIDFIESVRASGDGKVLVYCMSSLSRSPTIVIGYLMKTHGWRLLESYKWVKEKRASINLNAEDKKRLLDMELHMYNSCSVPEGFEAIASTSSGLFTGSTSDMAGVSMGHAAATAAAPAFAVPAGQSQWMLPPGPQGPILFQSVAPQAPGTSQGTQFVFGSPAGQAGSSNAEMEM